MRQPPLKSTGERNRSFAHKNTVTEPWRCSDLGGQLPASSGVCGSLALAQASVQQALTLFTQISDDDTPPSLKERRKRFRETADDWVIVVASMITVTDNGPGMPPDISDGYLPACPGRPG